MRDVLFLRVSTDEQAADDRYSLPMQERIARALSESSGGTVLRVFTEEQTAFLDDPDKRPVFQEALAYALEMKADRFIVYAFDRFARDPAVFYVADRMLQRGNVALISATQYHKPGTADGEMVKGFHALLANVESIRLSQRIRDALAQKARSGRYVGNVPFGYVRQDGEVLVDDAAAEGYRLAVKMLLEGAETYAEIGRALNSAGYRTIWGGPWCSSSVSIMLSNPAYTGQIVFDGDAGPGVHPPLVDRPTWERVQAKVRDLKSGPRRRRRGKSPFPLSGVLRCGRCGARMVGTTPGRSGHRFRTYHCSRRRKWGTDACPGVFYFSAESCERAVAAYLDTIRLGDGWREAVERELAKDAAPAGPTPEQLRAKQRRLMEMYRDGLYGEDYARFKREFDAVETELHALKKPLREDILLAGEMLELGLGRLWMEAGDEKARRKLVRLLFEGIYVDGEKPNAPEILRVEWRKEVLPLISLLGG